MLPNLKEKEEIDLLVDDPKHTEIDGLATWQVELLLNPEDYSPSASNICLNQIDFIIPEWLNTFTLEQWGKIRRQRSLFGITLPVNWIKVWRMILKDPQLRDTERSTRNGKNIGSYTHLWNVWSEDCIKRFTNEMDKELISLVDQGYLYQEIGERMMIQYGDQFWKPRKEHSSTTPGQVVNNMLYWKLPNKIARSELTELCLNKLKILNKPRKLN